MESRYDLSHILAAEEVLQSPVIHRGHLIQASVGQVRAIDGDFRNWQVYEATFDRCTFVRCRWSAADFRSVRFKHCILIDCSFEGSVDADFATSLRLSSPTPPEVVAPAAPPHTPAPPASAAFSSRFQHLD